jgi:hypothetical protein
MSRRKFTTVKSYSRKKNVVPSHRRYLSETQPINWANVLTSGVPVNFNVSLDKETKTTLYTAAAIVAGASLLAVFLRR